MAAVAYRLRAELRTRWRAVVALALLTGAAGGIALAAAAGARRTDTAYRRMLGKTNAWQVLVNPDDSEGTKLTSANIAALPMVSAAARVNGESVVPWPLERETDFNRFGITLVSDHQTMYTIARPRLVHGRVPDPDQPDEVLINPAFAKAEHVGVGDTINALAFTNADFQSGGNLPFAEIKTRAARGDVGLRLRLRVAGIGVQPDTLVVDEGFETPSLAFSPAFVRRYPDVAQPFWGEIVRLRNGAADIPALRRAIEKLAPGEAIAFQTTPVTEAKVARAVHPQVVALAVFALFVGLTGLLLVGQALARQSFLDSVDSPPLHALGFSRQQLFAGGMARAALVAVSGAGLAVALAVAVSPLTPIGPARLAEPEPGLRIDGLALGLGAFVVIVSVLALAAIPAWRYARSGASQVGRNARSSRLAGALTRAGAPISVGAGVRMALEPGRGRTAVPVRTTIVTAALAIATVTGALVFATSIDHLVRTPRLYGWNWDVRFDVNAESRAKLAHIRQEIGKGLDSSPEVAAWTTASLSQLNVNGNAMPAVGITTGRAFGPTIVAGRLPERDNEIALGARTMRTLSAGIGDSVHVAPEHGAARATRVVGRVVLPGFGTYPGSDKTALGEGAVVTRATLLALGANFDRDDFLVRWRPGSHGTSTIAAARKVAAATGDPLDFELSGVQRPSDIVAYDRVRSLPLLLAGVLAVLTMATVAHALVTAVRRRRRDLALLKTLGFSRGQTSGAVAWQATTVGVLALLIGIPLGIAGGRWGWHVLTNSLGTVSEPVVPALAALIGTVLVIVVLNLVAFVPGRIAARLPAATVLRSE